MADAHSKLTQLLSQMNAPPAPSVAPATSTTKIVLPTALMPSVLSAAAAAAKKNVDLATAAATRRVGTKKKKLKVASVAAKKEKDGLVTAAAAADAMKRKEKAAAQAKQQVAAAAAAKREKNEEAAAAQKKKEEIESPARTPKRKAAGVGSDLNRLLARGEGASGSSGKKLSPAKSKRLRESTVTGEASGKKTRSVEAGKSRAVETRQTLPPRPPLSPLQPDMAPRGSEEDCIAVLNCIAVGQCHRARREDECPERNSNGVAKKQVQFTAAQHRPTTEEAELPAAEKENKERDEQQQNEQKERAQQKEQRVQEQEEQEEEDGEGQEEEQQPQEDDGDGEQDGVPGHIVETCELENGEPGYIVMWQGFPNEEDFSYEPVDYVHTDAAFSSVLETFRSAARQTEKQKAPPKAAVARAAATKETNAEVTKAAAAKEKCAAVASAPRLVSTNPKSPSLSAPTMPATSQAYASVAVAVAATKAAAAQAENQQRALSVPSPSAAANARVSANRALAEHAVEQRPRTTSSSPSSACWPRGGERLLTNMLEQLRSGQANMMEQLRSELVTLRAEQSRQHQVRILI